jgi:hypothetical protein
MSKNDNYSANAYKGAVRGLIESIYGVNLHSNHKGFLVSLQFFAVVWGVENLEGEELFQEITSQKKLKFTRRTHDFARRLLRGEQPSSEHQDSWDERKRRISDDDQTLKILAKIFESLTVPDKFSTAKNSQSNKTHLRPCLGELIHHDYALKREPPGYPNAVEGINAERVFYRGGGTLVYELLRSDPDQNRRGKIEGYLRDVVNDSGNAVGHLAKLLARADAAPPQASGTQDAWEDSKLIPHEHRRETIWSENIRSGTLRILSAEIPQSRKIDYLMHWLPYCLANHMAALASGVFGNDFSVIPVDVGPGGGLRRASQRRLSSNRNLIRAAIIKTAGEATKDPLLKRIHQEDFGGYKIKNTLTSMASFYTATMAYVGALNHNKGIRHYTLDLPLLEAIVYATVTINEPKSFDDFCTEILYRQLYLVINRVAGEDAGFMDEINAADFEENEAGLASRLESLGLITNFSDATRMVGPLQ